MKIVKVCLAILILGCQRHADAQTTDFSTVTPVAGKKTLTAKGDRISIDRAIALVMKIPEANSWAKAVQKAGRIPAFNIDGDNLVETINGREYYSITIYEDTGDKFTRWMTFMVRVDGKAILIDDDLSDSDESRYITLEQWRAKMKRLGTDDQAD